MDDSRPIMHVTDFDHVAAIQILTCIARPYSDSASRKAGDLMQQWYWARFRKRGQSLPPELEIPIPDKDKIAPKLRKLANDLRDAFDAGDWLKLQWAAKSAQANGVRISGTSIRALAARRWNQENKEQIELDNDWIDSRDDRTASVRQKIWIRRRPVVHMALAVREELRDLYPEGLPAMEQVVFQPSWVSNALVRAERYAEAAIHHGILEPQEPWRFIR